MSRDSPCMESSVSICHLRRAGNLCDLSDTHGKDSLFESFYNLRKIGTRHDRHQKVDQATRSTSKLTEIETKHMLLGRNDLLLARLEFEAVLIRISRAPKLGAVVEQSSAVHFNKLFLLNLHEWLLSS